MLKYVCVDLVLHHVPTDFPRCITYANVRRDFSAAGKSLCYHSLDAHSLTLLSRPRLAENRSGRKNRPISPIHAQSLSLSLVREAFPPRSGRSENFLGTVVDLTFSWKHRVVVVAVVVPAPVQKESTL